MAKMTNEEFDKALDKITDQTSKAMLKGLLDALDRIGKLELQNYDSVAVNKVQQDLDERLIEIQWSFKQQVKELLKKERGPQ